MPKFITQGIYCLVLNNGSSLYVIKTQGKLVNVSVPFLEQENGLLTMDDGVSLITHEADRLWQYTTYGINTHIQLDAHTG